MRHSDEGRDDDFEVEIVDLPPDDLHTYKEEHLNTSSAHIHETVSKDDDFMLEMSDLPPVGTTYFASMLTSLWDRLKSLMPEVHVSVDPVEEIDDDDEGGFDFRIRDLPPEAEEDTTNPPKAPVQQKKLFWRSTPARSLIVLGAVLLVVLVVLPTTVPFMQRTVLRSLFASPSPTTTPKATAVHVIPSQGGWVVSSGADVQIVAGATVQIIDGASIGPVPTNCLPGTSVTDAHTIGTDPVWVSGFDGPQATIHLGNMPQTMISGRMGWSIVATIWMHFEQKVKVKFSADNQLESSPVPLFKFDLEDPLTPSISFSSSHLSIPDYNGNLTNNWFVTLFIPAAGCYILNASWPGGSWHLNFAAGQ